jgi:hypothetical protein
MLIYKTFVRLSEFVHLDRDQTMMRLWLNRLRIKASKRSEVFAKKGVVAAPTYEQAAVGL